MSKVSPSHLHSRLFYLFILIFRLPIKFLVLWSRPGYDLEVMQMLFYISWNQIFKWGYCQIVWSWANNNTTSDQRGSLRDKSLVGLHALKLKLSFLFSFYLFLLLLDLYRLEAYITFMGSPLLQRFLQVLKYCRIGPKYYGPLKMFLTYPVSRFIFVCTMAVVFFFRS